MAAFVGMIELLSCALVLEVEVEEVEEVEDEEEEEGKHFYNSIRAEATSPGYLVRKKIITARCQQGRGHQWDCGLVALII